LTKVYLSLGTNLGDRLVNLEQALTLLDAEGVRILRRSPVYETEPRDVLDQPLFLNMVAEAKTALLPLQLLWRVMRVEKKLGRKRVIRGGPRLIDIDVLLFGNQVIAKPGLTVPHPRMLERRFVLEPLLELAPEVRDPRTGRLLAEFLAAVNEQRLVRVTLS